MRKHASVSSSLTGSAVQRRAGEILFGTALEEFVYHNKDLYQSQMDREKLKSAIVKSLRATNTYSNIKDQYLFAKNRLGFQ